MRAHGLAMGLNWGLGGSGRIRCGRKRVESGAAHSLFREKSSLTRPAVVMPSHNLALKRGPNHWTVAASLAARAGNRVGLAVRGLGSALPGLPCFGFCIVPRCLFDHELQLLAIEKRFSALSQRELFARGRLSACRRHASADLACSLSLLSWAGARRLTVNALIPQFPSLLMDSSLAKSFTASLMIC